MTEHTYLDAIRESYDAVAVDYLKAVRSPAEIDPVGRAVLTAFAENVRIGGGDRVADVGCGPGLMTAHLVELGLSPFGIDLSPRMIELARESFPAIRFDVGSMTALDLGSQELDGILAWFSTYHIPPEHLPTVFEEFHRTLRSGGHVLIGVHVGEDEHLKPTHAYGGHPVAYESYLLSVDRIVELLEKAGLYVDGQLEQKSQKPGRLHAYLFAHRP